MAQLHTEKEKYGVSVAARIDPEMAQQILAQAERLGLSFAKMVSLIISRGFNPPIHVGNESKYQAEHRQKRLRELEKENAELKELDLANRKAIGHFIKSITQNSNEQSLHLSTFKSIRNSLREELPAD
jgi:hypothetical protein